MILKKIYTKIQQYPNLILCGIILIMSIITIIPYLLMLRLYIYDGYRTYHRFIANPLMCLFGFIVFCVFFLPIWDVKETPTIAKCTFLLFLCFFSIQLLHSVKTIWPHFENSIINRDVRFEIEKITLSELDNISDGNHIIYVGRPSCNYCNLTYDYLYKRTLEQPLKISYYNTELDRENNNKLMTDILDKYNIKSVPAVLFIVNGQLEKTILYEEIHNDFGAIIHNYKTQNIYFN